MSRKLQGKKREDVIQRWLAGEEDAIWEVKPTKTQDKYILRQRDQPNPPSDETLESPEMEDKGQEQGQGQEQGIPPPPPPSKTSAPKPTQVLRPPPPPPPQSVTKPKKQKFDVTPSRQPIINDDIATQILNELRAMGEERHERRAKKQQKKEIKRQIRKELPTISPDPDYEEAYEEYQPPQFPQRRTVNLIRNI
jgi:hypothetical protein